MNNRKKLEICRDRGLIFMTVSGLCIVAAAITGYSANAAFVTTSDRTIYRVCIAVFVIAAVLSGFISWVYWKGYENLRRTMYVNPRHLNSQAGVDRH